MAINTSEYCSIQSYLIHCISVLPHYFTKTLRCAFVRSALITAGKIAGCAVSCEQLQPPATCHSERGCGCTQLLRAAAGIKISQLLQFALALITVNVALVFIFHFHFTCPIVMILILQRLQKGTQLSSGHLPNLYCTNVACSQQTNNLQ